jgi:biofilm PGA synthesis N-glycosyltransferase PgaC
MWIIHLDYLLSLVWAYAMSGVLLLWLLGLFIELPPQWAVVSVIPGWTGMLIASTFLTQTLLAMLLDMRYDHHLWRNYFFMVWYPLAYWLIGMTTTVVAFPKALIRGSQQRGLWTSPDRGLR